MQNAPSAIAHKLFLVIPMQETLQHTPRILVISNYRGFHTVRPEAEMFIGLAQYGFQIHIMTYEDSDYTERFREAGIQVINFHPEKKLSGAEIRFIRDYLTSNRIDILHLFNNAAIINGIQAAKNLPVKVMLYRGYEGHIHWYDPLAYLAFLHPRVNKIICNSQGVEEYLQRQLFFGKEKTITINKGHRLEWYEHIRATDVRAELNLPSDSFLVVNVANNRKFKGIPYLLKAFNKIPNELPVYLILVGNDMKTSSNLDIINNGGKADKIKLLGFRKDAMSIVAGCDVFALASLYGESITKSVIEAMALGVAPVITDIPGNRELVNDGVNGLVVPARNADALCEAVLKLYDDKVLCKRFGENSRAHIRNHLNLDQTILQTRELYESLLQYNRR